MNIEMLEGKIHRATVTEANLDYVGSITVDISLLEESGIREYQKVQVVDVNNGNRIETYTIAGKKDSGVICLNGAAARLFSTGDKVIIMAYASYSEDELKDYKPKVVFVDDDNKINKVSNYEKYGTLS
ncbi:aspartate 1-decarboxylase [Anaerococcus sp.]|uniref:aspartate 1-decarboxylase n=1 Tax=Anaerococcus sp. TaxID=1872515 RepID=UPI0027B9D4B7|nr:aspartate 1-decarboxylase [Anaerococcus sp.]